MWKLLENSSPSLKEMRKSFLETIDSLMLENEKILVLEADLGGASGLSVLKKKYPKQFINVGIAEANMVGVAAGLSMIGYIPFIHSFAPFVSRRPADQLYLEGAYAKNTINVFASDPGICSAQNGGTHTTFEDIALLRAIPETKIFHPADAVQLSWLTKELSKTKGLNYMRSNRKSTANIYEEGSKFSIGKGNILKKGTSVLIISTGDLLKPSLEASEELESKGISTEVIDMFTIKPLDTELILNEIKGKSLIVTAENHSIIGGLGGAVAEVLAESACGIPLRRIGNKDLFGQVGSFEYLQEFYQMRKEDIVDIVLNQK